MIRRLPLIIALGTGTAFWFALSGSSVLDRSRRGADGEHVTIEDRFPDGTVHIRREVVRSAWGEIQNDGVLTVWYPGGQLRSIGHWRGGKKHGLFTHWHANGQKGKELHYVDGLADGVYTEWDDQGRLVAQEQWSLGQLVDSALPAVSPLDAVAQ